MGGRGRIVDPAWLEANPGVRVVDVRESWEYAGIGHLPGAVNIPFEAVRSPGTEDAGMLPGPARFSEVVGAAGITPDAPVVAYDDEMGVFAARFVLTMLVYGHADARLLDRDYSAWTRDHPPTTDPATYPPADYPVPPVAAGTGPLVDVDVVRAAIDDPGCVLVDTRTREEFTAGHLPGAVRLDWRALVDPETRRILPRPRVEAVLHEHGITRGDRLVLYCNTARRISHTYLVLTHAGFEDVGFYEGSLRDWNHRNLDLVTP